MRHALCSNLKFEANIHPNLRSHGSRISLFFVTQRCRVQITAVPNVCHRTAYSKVWSVQRCLWYSNCYTIMNIHLIRTYPGICGASPILYDMPTGVSDLRPLIAYRFCKKNEIQHPSPPPPPTKFRGCHGIVHRHLSVVYVYMARAV